VEQDLFFRISCLCGERGWSLDNWVTTKSRHRHRKEMKRVVKGVYDLPTVQAHVDSPLLVQHEVGMDPGARPSSPHQPTPLKGKGG